MDTEKIYKNLTSIDIEEQSTIQDERAIGYRGEFLVLSELLSSIDGQCKILMNLNLPINNSTTEIDLLMIHEKGIFVFEVKHYKGTIYGKTTDKNWTQYFRTQSNISFPNPIKQNDYHIKAIKKLYPDTPVHSIIVFSNNEVSLKVENSENYITVCTLSTMISSLKSQFSVMKTFYSPEEIDAIFIQLVNYSPIREKSISYKNETYSFYDYIAKINKDISVKENALTAKNNELDREKQAVEKSAKTKTMFALLTATLSLILCLFISAFCYNSFKTTYENKIIEFQKTYLRIDEIDDETINKAQGIIDVTDVKLTSSTELNSTIVFSCKLTNIATTYGIRLNENSTYIILTKDGRTLEYPVFNNSFKYKGYTYSIYPKESYRNYSCELKMDFYKISSPDNISYIKITNVSLHKDQYKNDPVSDNIQIEIYNADH